MPLNKPEGGGFGRLRHLADQASEADADGQVKPGSKYLEHSDHEHIFRPHGFPEHIVDLGEVRMNYAVAGSDSSPALLLIPGQTESWWGYEDAMHLLSASYQVYAIDLRGQGRSTWTPGRYTIDIFGNDVVRFIDRVIKRPVVVCGLSSGGVISAWLSAFAAPDQIIAAVYEDPPLFASETNPAVGQGIRQTVAGPMFRIWFKWLGPQWSVGNESGMMENMAQELPPWLLKSVAHAMSEMQTVPFGPAPELHEYDPEWGDAFWTGRAALACDHEAMLRQVKVPVFFTHHFHKIDTESGNLLGAISDTQVHTVQKLVESTGNSFTYRQFPTQPHSMHEHDAVTYVTAITEWFEAQGLGPALKPTKDQIPVKEKSSPASPPMAKPEPARPNEEMADLSLSWGTNGAIANPIDGVWDLFVQTPAGKQQIQMTIKAEGTSLVGHLKGNAGQGEANRIEDGKIDGSNITFRATIKIPVKVKVTYKATVDGDKLIGEAKTAMLPAISFTGVRSSS